MIYRSNEVSTWKRVKANLALLFGGLTFASVVYALLFWSLDILYDVLDYIDSVRVTF